ncbi:MAG TPA: family 16 glycoside hydrolase, partial [Planctomycetota bacterium]|nr:family 16 glycoside hydrolase [Planctomycetota bacterium]
VRPLARGLPGDGSWLAGVHPSYALHRARPSGFEPKVGGLDWLSDGRLVVCTWDEVGAVYVLDGAGGDDPEAIAVTRIAAGLAEPLGLEVVDDRIFVLQKQELTELVDEDGDGLTDYYRCVAGGWDVTANFHEFAFGLAYQDGKFYCNLAIAIDPGGRSTARQAPDRGSVLEIDAATGAYRVVARGLRTPNGIGVGDDGAIWLTDNQGDWLPCSKLLRLHEGAFFGNRSVLGAAADALQDTPPVVWLPQGEVGNSPGEVTPLRHGPYAGQLVHADVTHGGLKRTFVEEVDGTFQGAVFRFTQGLEGGACRVRNGPDGCLYVGGIGSTGNWGQEGKQRFGLQRLEYTGAPVFEPLAVRALANGFEVELTAPLAEGHGWDPDAWTVARWRYEPTSAYGGEKVGEVVLPVRSASVSADRTRVFVELDAAEVLPDHVYHLRVPPAVRSDSGARLWTTEAWYTLNAVPRDRLGAPLPNPHAVAANALSAEEREQGFELLFDGADVAAHWKGYGGDGAPEGWRAASGTLFCDRPGEDLVTRATYKDFELRFDWKVAPGGNSGVFYRVADGEPATYVTGPEYQILDNLRHADGRDPLTSAAANYALHAPALDPTRPAGAWNSSRLVVRGSHVEHWLNGEKLLEFELGSPDWEARVAASKFARWPRYGRVPEGRLALQDHGDPVWFRNLRVRRL